MGRPASKTPPATTGKPCLWAATTENCKAEALVGNRGLCGPHRYGVNKALKAKHCTEAQAIEWKLIEPRPSTRQGSVAFQVETFIKAKVAETAGPEPRFVEPDDRLNSKLMTPPRPEIRADAMEERVVDYLVVQRNVPKWEARNRCREARVLLRANASFESIVAECNAAIPRKAPAKGALAGASKA